MPSPRDRVIRGDELEPGMLLKFRDGSYRRVVRRETVLAQRDGIKLMVPTPARATARGGRGGVRGPQAQERNARQGLARRQEEGAPRRVA